jgi:hypothetical protein
VAHLLLDAVGVGQPSAFTDNDICIASANHNEICLRKEQKHTTDDVHDS